MLRTILEARTVLAMAVAMGVGAWGLQAYPVPPDDPFLTLIHAQKPLVFNILVYGYATLWFTTPFFAASLMASVTLIAVYRHVPTMRFRNLPP